MNKTDFQNLVTQHLSGTLNPDQEKKLLDYYDLLQETQLSWEEDRMGLPISLKENIYREAMNEIAGYEKDNKRNKIHNLFSKWHFAAASIIIILLPTIAYFQLRSPIVKIAKKNDISIPVLHGITPGGNKAILTLADGSQVNLDNTNNGIISKQSNVIISKTNNGQLTYHSLSKDQLSGSQTTSYNIIKTPIGGQYQIILSDSTKVWLNSASSIKFPTVFNDH